MAVYTGSTRLSSIIRAARAGTARTKAIIRAPRAGTLRASWVVRVPYAGTARMDSIVRAARAGSIRADSIVRNARETVLRLAARIAGSFDPYRIYLGTDGAVDFSTPHDTAASLPHDVDLNAGHTYRVTVRAVNAYGLESQNEDYTEYTIDGSGDEEATPPADADETGLSAIAAGSVRLTAEYEYLADGTDAADTWIYYLTTDGSDPDPDTDTPIEVAMKQLDGLAKLRVTLGPYATGTTVKAIVRTRRSGTPDVDSVSTGILTATADATAPADPDATAFLDAAGRD